MEKRKLTTEEIKDIFQVVKINKYYSQDVGYSVCLNIRKTLAKQLQNIDILSKLLLGFKLFKKFYFRN